MLRQSPQPSYLADFRYAEQQSEQPHAGRPGAMPPDAASSSSSQPQDLSEWRALEYASLKEEFERRTALRMIQEHYTGMLGIVPGDYKPCAADWGTVCAAGRWQELVAAI